MGAKKPKPMVVRKNARAYTVVTTVRPSTPTEDRVEAIARNLKAGSRSKAIIDVVDNVVSPALRRYGTE